MVGACVAYFVTNLVLVSGALAWTSSFWAFLLDDFPHYTATTFSVLALSPVIVAVASTAWELLPLLLIPLVLVYKMAQMSVEQEHQAGHDPLTGLPNRTRLQASLTAELARSKRDGRPFGLLLIDLDHFKEVNDTLGHHVGDQLLVHFAERLRNSVRPTDHVARLGGDEFAVIVPDADRGRGARRGRADPRVAGEPDRAGRACGWRSRPRSGWRCTPTTRCWPRTCCGCPTSRCTWPRSPAAGWPPTPRTATATPPTG